MCNLLLSCSVCPRSDILFFKLLQGQRAVKIIALTVVKTALHQKRPLLLLLDSLKNHLLLCRLDELPHLIDKSTLSVLVDFVGKALVDLHYIRRDFQQHAQRRVAGSEIIDGDAVAEFAKSGKTRL